MMRKYMTTTGHKLIGILYGYSGYIGGLLGFYFSGAAIYYRRYGCLMAILVKYFGFLGHNLDYYS